MVMKEFIKENLSKDKKYFYLTGLLSQLTGQLDGNVGSMRDDNLTSLDKKYFAEKIEAINNKLIELRDFLHDQDLFTIAVNPEKIK
jgi:hypothetical protein